MRGPELLSSKEERNRHPRWVAAYQRYCDHFLNNSVRFLAMDARQKFMRATGRENLSHDWYTLEWAMDEAEGLHLETKMSDASIEYEDILKGQELMDELS